MSMRSLKQSSWLYLFVTLALVSTLFGQHTIHVKPTPVVFTSPSADLTLNAGQGFVDGLSYDGGVAPYTCTLAPTPANGTTPAGPPPPTFVAIDGTTAGYCTVRADSVPYSATDVSFMVVVTDSKSSTSSVLMTITTK